MEILEHQDERGLGGHDLEGLRHLAQHALLRDPEQVTMRRRAIVPALEPGKLDDPGGCTGLEEADRPFAPGRAEKPAESFEDRQICLRCAVVLEACAGRQHHVWID